MTILEAAAARGTTVSFDPDSVLVHHGDSGRCCYVILDGEVQMTVATRDGATVMLGRGGRGTVVGDLDALGGGPRSATVVARTEVQAFVMSGAAYQQMLLADPRLALDEMKRLARQIDRLSERISIRNERLHCRVSQVLTSHVAETGERMIRATRQELADWVGATREAVTRVLRDLERSGLVRLARGTVEVLNHEGLVAFGFS